MIKKHSGFTLVELLLASAIFSVLILSIYSAFRVGIASYNRIDASFEKYQQARLIFNKIESDFKGAFVYLSADSKFKGEKEELKFFNVVDYFDRNGETYPEVCRLVYKFNAEKLERTCFKGLDALDDSLAIEPDTLITDIKDIKFSYACLVAGNPDRAFDWQEKWPADASQESKVPLAVKIEITFVQKASKKAAQEETKVSKIVAFNSGV